MRGWNAACGRNTVLQLGRITTFTTAILLIASHLTAQQQTANLADRSTPISYGDTLTGYLTEADQFLSDGSYYEPFRFAGRAGDTVTIASSSVDFNSFLLLVDSLEDVLASDNDTGGMCDSHLTYVLPETGRYMIYATSFEPDQEGEFQLSLGEGAIPSKVDRPCAGFFDKHGTIGVGDSIMGTLGPPDAKLGPSYYEVWGIEVPEGRTVTIDFRSSAFDARLTLYRGFATAIDANDDGGGGCNARLVLTGDRHPHRVVMTSGDEDETGPYVLRVTRGAKPLMQESQCEGSS